MRTRTLILEFEEGDIVYLKTDPEQLPRMVTAYKVRGGVVTYELSLGEACSWHQGVEISYEKITSI
jgi:hypothetical protein